MLCVDSQRQAPRTPAWEVNSVGVQVAEGHQLPSAPGPLLVDAPPCPPVSQEPEHCQVRLWCLELCASRLLVHGSQRWCLRQAAPLKRKVGRPIADHRHPDSPSLTPQVWHAWHCHGTLRGLGSDVCPACRCVLHMHPVPVERPSRRWAGAEVSWQTAQERRRIKRRIANRESARRVRARRQGALEEMLQRVRCAPLHVQWVSLHGVPPLEHVCFPIACCHLRSVVF